MESNKLAKSPRSSVLLTALFSAFRLQLRRLRRPHSASKYIQLYSP